MDEKNTIGHEGKLPWALLPTDYYWYLTHATTTKDASKRVALILGRLTFEDVIKFDKKYLSKWHLIVITKQLPEIFYNTYADYDRNHIDVVNSFDQAAHKAKQLLDTPSSMIESVFVFGGVRPYEQALESKLVQRIYLTRIFAEVPQCDTRVSNFDLSDFRRIKRSSDEILAELDDKIFEENGWKYQFQTSSSSLTSTTTTIKLSSSSTTTTITSSLSTITAAITTTATEVITSSIPTSILLKQPIAIHLLNNSTKVSGKKYLFLYEIK
ncbi:unnamed protein product [Rotaria sordida]|uniref:dihydrofolate reductase n=1 Tax=Rotaria sordida TaxID=392033 RepID=A0A814BLM3_9BILA|nr:unnamed protein product [Rotaria sordida]CAF3594570.1 unnamed protein product [Rotaria sordida]CAF3720445.1 unnamed protein product [Rotaria sordida]